MKKLTICLILFCFIDVSGQQYLDVAFKNELITKAGKEYYQGKLFSGTLLEDIDNKLYKNKCNCRMETAYKNGLKNGKEIEWYSNGNKKRIVDYLNGSKNGIEIYFAINSNKVNENTYNNGILTDEKIFWENGKLKVNKKYNKSGINYKIEYSNNGNLILEYSYFKDNLIEKKDYYPSGRLLEHIKYVQVSNLLDFEKRYFDDIKNSLKEETTYQNGKIIKSQIFNENGILLVNKIFVNNYLEVKRYSSNSNLISTEFYLSGELRDSTWINYNNEGLKVFEVKYNKGAKEYEGSYINNQKNGIWSYYSDNESEILLVTYENGNEIETKKINTKHLLSSYKNNDNIILTFKGKAKSDEIVVLNFDRSFYDSEYTNVKDKILEVFYENIFLNFSSQNKFETIDNVIKFSNLKIEYREDLHKELKFIEGKGMVETGRYEIGYDCFIIFNMNYYNNDNLVISENTLRINRSAKLLNSFLNSYLNTYSRTTSDAYLSALNAINFKPFFKEYYPIQKTKKK